jgi:hypothetical protein
LEAKLMAHQDITSEMPFGSDIKYEWVLNIHLNRLAQSIQGIDTDARAFARNVDMLEFLLTRDLTPKYKERWGNKQWPRTNEQIAQRGYEKLAELMVIIKEVLPPGKAPRGRFASK